jgi:AraC-like DNA-binding protein
LDDEIDENKIAVLSALPKGMFQRIFAVITDMTLSEYIRKRRLTRAVSDIRDSNARIIDIAIKYGYISANSFSAAFKCFHGVTPSYARTSASQLQYFHPLVFTLTLSDKGGNHMQYRNIKCFDFEGFSQDLQIMEDKILPELLSKTESENLRIWDSCSSSGQEAYGIAMAVSDLIGSGIAEWETTILATDLSDNSLEAARHGVYGEEHLSNMKPEWIAKYFDTSPNGHYKVKEFLRKRVNFELFDLMSDIFPFKKKFHIIFCRNAMVFFDASAREKLFEKYYYCMENGGYLVIGMSETLSDIKTDFKMTSPSVY